MVTAKREDREITRNSSKFKPVFNPPDLPGTDETEETFVDNGQDNTSTQDSASTNMPRRSTRIRKTPEYLKDYVCK